MRYTGLLGIPAKDQYAAEEPRQTDLVRIGELVLQPHQSGLPSVFQLVQAIQYVPCRIRPDEWAIRDPGAQLLDRGLLGGDIGIVSYVNADQSLLPAFLVDKRPETVVEIQSDIERVRIVEGRKLIVQDDQVEERDECADIVLNRRPSGSGVFPFDSFPFE
ncbi:MAG: hypothetical protein U9R74_19585, partial [Pseudomonadota bacterium]|nr:hypothetical protein [Pseudomonadota bacterium]